MGKENQSMDAAFYHANKGDVEFFIDAPLDILLKARDSIGDTVLDIVVYRKHVDCCEMICKRCPKLLRSQTGEGEFVLHNAVHYGNLDILKILISTCDKADLEYQHDIEEQGGDTADQQKTLMLRTTKGTTKGYTAMHIAVGKKLESIKLLIEADTNKELLRAVDSKRNTPLHLAVGEENHRESVVELLIKADPDFPYGANSDGKTPLLMAIEKANCLHGSEMLRLILKLQPTQSMVKYNGFGWTALHYCVSKKFVDTIGSIIQSCPESSKVADNEGQNFFHHAVKSGNVEMVKQILGMKKITSTVLSSPDKLERTPLDVAAESQNESMILLLLEDLKVDLNWFVKKHNFVKIKMFMEIDANFLMKVDPEVFLNSVDENGDTIFSKAAQENHLFLCKELYNRCPSLIYHRSKGGHTALHDAASRGEPEMLKFLIEARTKSFNQYVEDDIESEGQKMLLTMLDDQGDTALHKAVLNHKLKAVKLLVEANPDYRYGANNSGDTPIMISIREAQSNENKFDSVEIRRLLFKMQPRHTMAPVHTGEINGWTLLHQATSEEDLSIIEDIIKFCAEYLDVVDNNGKNFLHIAAELGKVEVVRLVFLRVKYLLIKCLKQLDDEGKNFLHIAAEMGNIEVVRLVLRAKDINLKSCLEQLDNEGRNFLHIAAELGNIEVVRLVLRAKDTNLKSCLEQLDNEDKNFLHIAAEFEKVEVVKMILRVKDIPPDVLNKKDKDGNTPFHIAALTGNEPLTRCFLFDPRVKKNTVNVNDQHVLSAIKFPYDKRKAGVVGIADTVDQSDLKDQSDFDLVVGALIATVSFTAGITVPGGYISDGPNQGTAVFSKKVSFATFIISNTFALIFSLYAVFSHFCARRMPVEADIIYQLKVATYCTLAAIYCMMAAFIAGSFAVLANSDWLAIVACIISCFFFISAFRPMWKIAKQHKFAACHKRCICFGFF